MHPVTDVSVHFASEPFGGLAQISAWQDESTDQGNTLQLGGETVMTPPGGVDGPSDGGYAQLTTDANEMLAQVNDIAISSWKKR